MKRKRILLSRSLVFASLSLIVATFQCAPKKSGLVVGFSQIGAESDWRTAETSSIREEAKKRGISLKFSDAQQYFCKKVVKNGHFLRHVVIWGREPQVNYF